MASRRCQSSTAGSCGSKHECEFRSTACGLPDRAWGGVERNRTRCQQGGVSALNVSRGTERSDPSASSTCSLVGKCIGRAKRRIIWAPCLSGKDQHQSPGPHQAQTKVEPFIWRKSRTRRSNIKAARFQPTSPFANNFRVLQLKLACGSPQERDALCPWLDQCEPRVRPGDSKRQPRKTSTSADVDHGRSRRNQTSHGEAIHDMLGNHFSHGPSAGQINA